MIRNICLGLAVSVVGMGSASSLAAAPSNCAALGSTVVSNSTGCAGFFAGNIFNQSDAAVQQAGAATLGATFDGNFGGLTQGSRTGNLVSFGQTLYGVTVVGMHFGNIWDPQNVVTGGQGNGNNVSVLWKFDFGSAGATGIVLNNTRGWSNAVLYDTGNFVAVPEPSAWALLILGFGAVGGSMRIRRRERLALTA